VKKRLTVFDMLQPKSQPTKIIFKMLFFQLLLADGTIIAATGESVEFVNQHIIPAAVLAIL